MSTYDQLSLSSRPVLYLSAPDITDKSGTGLFALANNNLDPTGQPIIYGNESSFYITDTTTVDIVGNPLFFVGNTALELVCVLPRPTEEVSIVIDDDVQNALMVNSNSIFLRLFFETETSTYSKQISIPVTDWDRKFYIRLSMSDTQATLQVNEKTEVLEYDDVIVASTNLQLGGGYSGYFYLIDGIGFYAGTVAEKQSVINDPGSGHELYAALKHQGVSTLFNNSTGYTQAFKLSDFTFTHSPDLYNLVYFASQKSDSIDYIAVRSTDENVQVKYLINMQSAGEFTEYILLANVNNATITFYIEAGQATEDFTLEITAIENANIETDTPALLQLEGMALYSEPANSIVNYPDGVILDNATYTGTWIGSIPNTIELVFKPYVDTGETVIFSSTDGEVSFGTGGVVSGYTIYLNGSLVTDLTDLKMGQWNHLVILDASPSATEFYLNSSDGLSSDKTIAYMSLTAYPEELSADQISYLYEILSGTDDINVEEPPVSVVEGEFDTTTAFNYYSYAWAIVGAGGS